MSKDVKVLIPKTSAKELFRIIDDEYQREKAKFKLLISKLSKKDLRYASAAELAKALEETKKLYAKDIKVAKARISLIEAEHEGNYNENDKKLLEALNKRILRASNILSVIERKEKALYDLKRYAYLFHFIVLDSDSRNLFPTLYKLYDIAIGKFGKYSDTYHNSYEEIMAENEEQEAIFTELSSHSSVITHSMGSFVNVIEEATPKKNIDIPLDEEPTVNEEDSSTEENNTTSDENNSSPEEKIASTEEYSETIKTHEQPCGDNSSVEDDDDDSMPHWEPLEFQ